MYDLKIKVAGGYLLASVDPESQTANVAFQTNPGGDIVDLACVEMCNDNNERYYQKHHNDPDDFKNYKNISIQTYGDPYTEDYTHQETIDIDDILKACEDPDVPIPDSMRC